MKKLRLLFIVIFSAFLFAGCTEKAHEVPDWRKYIDDGDKVEPPSGESIPSDMVLLYGGSHHRSPYKWSGSYLQDYVLYKDAGEIIIICLMASCSWNS